MTYDAEKEAFSAWQAQQLADKTILERADWPLAWRAFRAGVASARPEEQRINAAQIIGWARMVRNASAGRSWTDTEIKLADAIMEIAGPREPQRGGS